MTKRKDLHIKMVMMKNIFTVTVLLLLLGKTTQVKVNILIRSMGPISEMKMVKSPNLLCIALNIISNSVEKMLF